MNRIAGWLVLNKKNFKKRDVYSYHIKVDKKENVEKKALSNYKTGKFSADGIIAEYAECAIHDNSNLDFLPNYVVGPNGVKYFKQTFVSMAKRVYAYEISNNNSPAIVYLSKNDISSKNKSKLLDSVQKAFGKFSTCDEWLSKIQGKGYKYYYNNVYDNNTTLKRIKDKKGVNCTDSTELTYNILISLDYAVQVIHVKCKKSGGHVRLRAKHKKHTNNKWIYRDPAAVLAGNSITHNWCMDGTIIAYDPSWIMATIKK